MKKLLIVPAVAVSAIALTSCEGVKEKKYSNKIEETEYYTKINETMLAFSKTLEEKGDVIVEGAYEETITTVELGIKTKTKDKMKLSMKYDKDSKVYQSIYETNNSYSSKDEKRTNKTKYNNVVQEEEEGKFVSYDLICGTYSNSSYSPSIDILDLIGAVDPYETEEVEFYYDENGDVKLFTIVYKVPEKVEGESIVQIEFKPEEIEIYSYYDIKIDYNKVQKDVFNEKTLEYEKKNFDVIETSKSKSSLKISCKDVKLEKQNKADFKEEIDFYS